VIEVSSCKNSTPSVISCQRIPVLDRKQNSTSVKDLLLHNLTSSYHVVIRDVMLSKFRLLNYSELDYLYCNSTLHIVTTYSAAPVFCYCSRQSVWFWCCEKLICRSPSDMYDVLKGNKNPELKTAEEWKDNGQSESACILRMLVVAFVAFIVTATS
jgi:hypothetical protein